jgi:hypothetical protein
MFVPGYSFTLTEHDADRPWIVVNQEHLTAALEERVNFFEWANERWPAPQWRVELDPWQLGGTRAPRADPAG